MKAIKTIFYLAAAWGILSLGAACNKTEELAAAISLDGATATLSSSGIKVSSAENVKHLGFTSAISWTIAETIGADPRAVVIAVFIASSVAVCTPMAIPANAMILGPGNVRFKDFLVPGLAVSAVCFVVSMILLPIFYPFYPG